MKKSSTGLTEEYAKASKGIINRLLRAKVINIADLKITFRKILTDVRIRLERLTSDKIVRETELGYEDGINRVTQVANQIFNGRALTKKNLMAEGLNPIDKMEAENLLQLQTENYSKQMVYRKIFLELRKELLFAQNGAMEIINSRLEELSKYGQNTVLEAKKAIVKEYADRNIFTITYANGAKVDCGAYADMVARTARTECANISGVRMALEIGTNLVICVGQYPTCSICGMYRDRVFCIDGSDTRFPPLRGNDERSPLKNGYNLIHPNCRCEFLPFFEQIQSTEDMNNAIRRSNAPMKDRRAVREKEAYQKWQEKNRQLREEAHAYYRLKEKLGSSMPYKNLGAFRRAYRGKEGSFEYKKSHYMYRDGQQYTRWRKIVGQEKIPKTLAKFQELKYNNREKFEALRLVKEEAFVKMDYETVLERIGPLSNYSARRWYFHNVKSIGERIDKSLPLSAQAKQAYELRNKYRTAARDLMKDKETRKKLDDTHKNKSFEQIVLQEKAKGKTGDEIYKSIIESACRSNKKVNAMFMIEDNDGI